MMTPSAVFRNIDTFDSCMLRAEFPHIDLLQLSPGSFRGRLFSSQMETCRLTVGCFNQAVLCEGCYNADTLHLGFILSPGHSAVVQAHKYDNGTLTLHRNAITMHEVFPADLTWVDIAIPEKFAVLVTKKLSGLSQLFLKGARESLAPLIQWVNAVLASPARPPVESKLQAVVTELIASRLANHEYQQTFTAGDRFRMHLLDVTHECVQKHDHPQLLAEICTAIGMKPRTVQKYFHEIYGMGPTEYFRIRHLNGARAEFFMGADTVSEVAYRWKFAHLGRFAGRYKIHFGESPKTTIGRV